MVCTPRIIGISLPAAATAAAGRQRRVSSTRTSPSNPGIACTKMMQESGITEIIGCDRQGAISTERFDYVDGGMSPIKRWYAENSNPDKRSGGPNEAIEGCDLFIGLSGRRSLARLGSSSRLPYRAPPGLPSLFRSTQAIAARINPRNPGQTNLSTNVR